MPITPAPEEVFTIAPPESCMSGISCFMHRKTPVRLMSMIRCHSSVVRSAVGVWDCSTPALLNATSSRPKASTVRASAAWTSSSRVTSQVSASARPPFCSMSRAVSRTSSSGMPATATAAPSAAKARAVVRPMPLPAPVTKATLSVKRRPSVSVMGVPPCRGRGQPPVVEDAGRVQLPPVVYAAHPSLLGGGSARARGQESEALVEAIGGGRGGRLHPAEQHCRVRGDQGLLDRGQEGGDVGGGGGGLPPLARDGRRAGPDRQGRCGEVTHQLRAVVPGPEGVHGVIV